MCDIISTSTAYIDRSVKCRDNAQNAQLSTSPITYNKYTHTRARARTLVEGRWEENQAVWWNPIREYNLLERATWPSSSRRDVFDLAPVRKSRWINAVQSHPCGPGNEKSVQSVFFLLRGGACCGQTRRIKAHFYRRVESHRRAA